MFPDLFTIPIFNGITIHSYGAMVALAFFVGITICARLARQTPVDPQNAFDMLVYVMIAAILGSHIFYVIAHPYEFVDNPIKILIPSGSGLTFMGGVAGGAVAVILFAKIKKIPLWPLADAALPSLALGAAIGRIGCFLNGCCHGFHTDVPWAVSFPNIENGLPVHPTQIYDSLMNFGTFIFLFWFFPKRKYDGQMLVLWMTIYPFTRSVMEYFRRDASADLIGFFTVGQLASLGIFIGGQVLRHFLTKNGKKVSPPPEKQEGKTPQVQGV